MRIVKIFVCVCCIKVFVGIVSSTDTLRPEVVIARIGSNGKLGILSRIVCCQQVNRLTIVFGRVRRLIHHIFACGGMNDMIIVRSIISAGKFHNPHGVVWTVSDTCRNLGSILFGLIGC